MPIKVSCSQCGGVLHAPDDAAGKRGRCPTCGTILQISADAPRVAAEAPPPAFGAPPAQEPLAFPKPPLFGDAPPRASAAATGATASRVPAMPGRGDPFGRPSPATTPPNALAKRWKAVDRGLSLTGKGFGLIVLGLLIPTALAILEQNGVAPFTKNPGVLGVNGVALSGEIKVGAAIVCFLLGGLLLVMGRLGVARAPKEAGAKSIARAAVLGSIIAFVGFGALTAISIAATLDQAPPQLLPLADVTAPNVRLQQRIENYCKHLFLPADDLPGQVQRFGAIALLAGGVLAELWFLGTLARLAVHLRSPRAVGRVNGFVVALGVLMFAATMAWLALELTAPDWAKQNVDPRWNNLNQGAKVAVRAGGLALTAALLALAYTRCLGGVRRAIDETHPA